MGRSMTDIEDVRSAAQLFASLQRQGTVEGRPGTLPTLHTATKHGLLARLHLTQGLSYPATCAPQAAMASELFGAGGRIGQGV